MEAAFILAVLSLAFIAGVFVGLTDNAEDIAPIIVIAAVVFVASLASGLTIKGMSNGTPTAIVECPEKP